LTQVRGTPRVPIVTGFTLHSLRAPANAPERASFKLIVAG